MIMTDKRIRALGLCSGGLDSILAALLLKEQGMDVEWVTFTTPFFSSEKAEKAACIYNIPITVLNIIKPYLKMLKNPPCGYGKHMNPCMDCHALMFKLAGKMMEEKGFDFLFSGEVLGQRPMSQTRPSLRYVEKTSGYAGYILRPLSAEKLPETLPEKNGFVRRELLMDFTGRSRKPQIELAEKMGVNEYPGPAGGCLLTDKGYAARLKDLFDKQDKYAEEELHLLRYGRHIRLNEKTKIIVGRNQSDNDSMLNYYHADVNILIKVQTIPGPIVLFYSKAGSSGDRADILAAASICAGYSKAPRDREVLVDVRTPDSCNTVRVIGTPPSENSKMMI
ncbi:MAG: tRNA 4-thiouridine(8) synthase ThiI [Deltaproteobacteria bacterium]|nr:tRNA 4-thiouridine(8) synthase ThiI [Deltaproteobacteria bacterium]